MKALNARLNPARMTPEVREKLRESHLKMNTGAEVSYKKVHGRHEHRIKAEELLGRKLRRGEVVHHIDGNRRNNSLDNLMVFQSQSDHAKWHNGNREVMPVEVRTT